MTAAKLLRLQDSAYPSASISPMPEAFLPTRLKPFQKKAVSNKIALPTMEGLLFEKTKRLLYLEASGNYTMLHFTDGRQILVCKTLREVETMVPETDFVRIHRSHTVHLKHLKKYIRGKGGYVVLLGGATLAVSSGQKDFFIEAVRAFFGHVS